ncbi:membrane protein [Schizophyllum commune]
MSSEEYHQSPFEARPAQSSLPRRRLQFPDPASQQYSSSESANPSSVRNGSARRRVVSVDGKYGYNGVAPVKPRRRPISLIGTVPETSREAGNTSLSADDLSLGTFSDEYDLYPRLIQEVQRAIKLKARREARAKASPGGPRSQASSRSSLHQPFHLIPPPMRVPADIDFAPSTSTPAKTDITNVHPVPTSLDGGNTLDWSVHTADEEEKEEKRWKLMLSKKKGKEKETLLNQSDLVKQENQFVEGLRRIRTSASPQTLHKAAITNEQLTQRYSFLQARVANGSNLLDVARWYGGQHESIRSAMEQSQPFVWLKHLDKPKKERDKDKPRPPWNLTALTLDAYTRAHNIHSITEEPSSPASSPRTSHSVPYQSAPFSFPSRSASRFSLKPSLNQRFSPESNGRVSFEPLIESLRGSLDHRSRRSIDSAYSSNYSSASGLPGASPVNLKPQASESEGSSAPHSSSSHEDNHAKKPGRYPVMDLNDPAEMPNIRVTNHSRSHSREPQSQSPDLTDVPLNIIPPSDEGTPDPEMRAAMAKSSPFIQQRALPRRILARRSLPSTRKESQDSQKRHATQERTRREYEQKAQLLESTMSQNSRLRQLLHRVAGNVKEYENVQSSISRALGLPYKSLPQEVLDAFSHDPAAVTGSTRRLRGYRAVDDIHKRLRKQQETLQNYLSESGNSGKLETSGSIFDDSISSLLTTITALEGHRNEIYVQARNVTEVLQRVQVLHAETKSDYNAALAHTSVVYPELSTIVTLEESYRDQYQQFWEVGMNLLTFLLDTITPFWRTYGKRIGDDVMDFLIIPLYRNEFTGEAKRYPIKRIPKRSFMHWVYSALFFWGSTAVTFLQIRTALSSTAHFRLELIEHDGLRYIALPFFWIGIILQWIAVLTEIAVVLTQLGVLFWWICWFVRLVD